jgi:dihydrofolate reductase
MSISIIAAMGPKKEIGYQNRIPWTLPTDQLYFRKTTLNHPIIMGRKTCETKSKNKPFPDRTNIILTRKKNYDAPGCLIATSLEAALKLTSSDEIFIIGGAEIYAIALPYAVKMYITEVDYPGPADTFFPDFNIKQWDLTSSKQGIRSERDEYDFRFMVYNKILQPIY